MGDRVVLIPNNAVFGSSADALVSGELEPAYVSMRAIRSGRSRLKLRAGDALALLLSGRAECVVWAGHPLTWQRIVVTAMLNVSALLSVSTFGLLIWASHWWSFLAVPALAMFYIFWAQTRHILRTVVIFTLLSAGIVAAIFAHHVGPELIWLFVVVVSCLGIQATHYLALHQVRTLALTDEKALEGLERKGIARVVPMPR